MAIKTSGSHRKVAASKKGTGRHSVSVLKAVGATRKEAVPQRFSLSLPPLQSEALNAMADSTSLSKKELIRNAVALLSVAHRARQKGLRLALVDDDDDVVGHIVATV